jgi:hypothetical protein
MNFANIFRKYRSLFETSKPLAQSINFFPDVQVCSLIFKLLIFITIVMALPANAQLPNQAFYLQFPVQEADSGKLTLHTYAMGFSRNNEYFGRFADGYTLFGYQAMPWLSYQPDKRVRLWAGLFARDDFGNRYLSTVQPVFRLQVKFDSLQFIFGTLQGSLNHQLVEPMYDFERVMADRLEEGMQLLWERQRFWLDVWIDWERTIYTGSPFQEVVSGGFSARADLVENEKLKLVLPLQMLAFHQGGQIDTDPNPLITRVNTALGLELHKEVGRKFLHSYSLQPYVLGYKDASNEALVPFEQGWGLYLNAAAYTKLGGFMLSYWKGDGYIPIKGGPLFSSYSFTYDNPGAASRERQILMLRLLNDIPVGKHLTLSLRAEPFYDLTEKRFEFSHGTYLNYRGSFELWNRHNSKKR